MDVVGRLRDERKARPQLAPGLRALRERRRLSGQGRRLHFQIREVARVGLRPRILVPLELPLVADERRFGFERDCLHGRRDRIVQQALRVFRRPNHAAERPHPVDVLLASDHRNDRDIPPVPLLLVENLDAVKLVPFDRASLRLPTMLDRLGRDVVGHLVGPHRHQRPTRVEIRHPLGRRALDDKILHHPDGRRAVWPLAHPRRCIVAHAGERVVQLAGEHTVGELALEPVPGHEPADERPLPVAPVRLLGVGVEVDRRLVQNALDRQFLIEVFPAIIGVVLQHTVCASATLDAALERPVPRLIGLRPHLDVPDQPLQHLGRLVGRVFAVGMHLDPQPRVARLVDDQLHRLIDL